MSSGAVLGSLPGENTEGINAFWLIKCHLNLIGLHKEYLDAWGNNWKKFRFDRAGDDIFEVCFKLGYGRSGSLVSQQAGRGQVTPPVSGNPPGVKCQHFQC